jgi:uncharacterized protein (TIGR03083 family)
VPGGGATLGRDMAIDDSLRGLDPVNLMDAEAARLEAHFGGLEAAAWGRPSRCEGWTTRDVLAHLAATEAYHHACLDGTVAELLQEMIERGATTVGEFNAVGIAGLDGASNDELLRTWARENAETRRRFRERGDGEVDTSVGLYPARWQAFHLAGELAVHADDVFVPVPGADRAARRDWRTRFSRFVLLEAKPDISTESEGGRTRVTGDGIDAELDDDDFVEAVAGRSDPSRVGDDVRRLLSTMP